MILAGEKRGYADYFKKMQETGDYYKRTYQDNNTKYRGRKYQLDDTLKLALIRDLKNMNIDLTFI